MPKPKQVDFLTPTSNQIRHQIKNILDSYNHDWDLIAELAQNSVDAISKKNPIKGHIRLEINASERKITFTDNGCGISPAHLPNLLAPFSSDKGQDPTLIGNKGVGISFVIFSSALFEIVTHHSKGSSRASISGARAWLDNREDELPKLNIENISPAEDTGTTVSISLPSNISQHEFFELSFEQLQMVLRTKTAIGDTRTVWGAKADKDIHLKFVNLAGEEREIQFDCSYFLPISRLTETQYISLRHFQDWNTGDRTDAQKREKLRNKLIYLDGKRPKAGRHIQYWACFVPKRRAWDTVSVNSKLIGHEILQLNPQDRIEQFGDAEYLFSGGMFTSTRGMPTGIRSDMRPKGSAGYLPNFFVLVDDPHLSFDIGRKSIPGRQLGMLRDVAGDVFRDFINTIKKYVSGEPDTDDMDGWNRTAMFNEIRAMPDLATDKTRFLKRPSSQEATIVAIFFELLGQGVLGDFRPYISGYRNKYDLYSKYKNSDVVLEFKYALSSLFSDFDNEVKLFDEVDIVVVWDIVEKDYEVVHSRGFDLQEIDDGLSGETNRVFHFKMALGPTKPIQIICLRKLIGA